MGLLIKGGFMYITVVNDNDGNQYEFGCDALIVTNIDGNEKTINKNDFTDFENHVFYSLAKVVG
jgi:hypothetical protein